MQRSRKLTLRLILLGTFVTALAACGTNGGSPSQSGPAADIKAVNDFINGQAILITFREGEVIYGTYYFLEYQFCTSGQYIMVGYSERETYLGNRQITNVEDQGSWSIISKKGQLMVELLSTSGERGQYPVFVQEDGRVTLSEGLSVVHQGPARCG